MNIYENYSPTGHCFLCDMNHQNQSQGTDRLVRAHLSICPWKAVVSIQKSTIHYVHWVLHKNQNTTTFCTSDFWPKLNASPYFLKTPFWRLNVIYMNFLKNSKETQREGSVWQCNAAKFIIWHQPHLIAIVRIGMKERI